MKALTLMKLEKKVNTTKWISIYEVIDEAYIIESNIFPDNFIRECKNIPNEAQFIPIDEKIA